MNARDTYNEVAKILEWYGYANLSFAITLEMASYRDSGFPEVSIYVAFPLLAHFFRATTWEGALGSLKAYLEAQAKNIDVDVTDVVADAPANAPVPEENKLTPFPAPF